jgi:hypothetical protein
MSRMGWTYWAGGPRMGSFILSIEPFGYPPVDNHMMLVLLNFVRGPILEIIYPDISMSHY